MKEINEIKEQTNKVLLTYIHKPWDVYVKRITKNEVKIMCEDYEKVIKLSCRTWQDNYFNEPVQRGRLDIYIYGGEGNHLYMSSQYDPIPSEKELEKGIEIKPPQEYLFIEKAISSFYEIAKFYEKKKELEKESADISPGSPMDRLNEEFYGKIEELMLK